ncbi:unnamed protein product [Prorocentrum cordatum]|uniref:Uncharacterized protein n=1 Tax=Prorocentrum cordatum TaxID=2364126 RepID=A0ABN9V2X6_9DINO|nr:unnamed protein product [Polarella glacialis]
MAPTKRGRPSAYVPEDDADIDEEHAATDSEKIEDTKPLVKRSSCAAEAEEASPDNSLLDAQIEKMRIHCVENNIKQPSMAILNEYLHNASLKSGARQKLKAARGKKDMSVQEAWTALCESNSGKKTDIKNDILFAFVRGDATWAERLGKQVPAFSKEEKREVKQQEFTGAELGRIHGYEETEAFIAKVKLVAFQDSWGDTVYIKSTRSRTKSMSLKKDKFNERSRRVDDGNHAQSAEAAETLFNSSAASFFGAQLKMIKGGGKKHKGKEQTCEQKVTAMANKTGNLIAKLTTAQIARGKDPMAKAVSASLKAAIDDLAKTNKANMMLTAGAPATDANKAAGLFNPNTEKAKTLLAKAKSFTT